MKREASHAKEGGKREKLSGIDRAWWRSSGKDHRKWARGSVRLEGEGTELMSRLQGKAKEGELLSPICCLWS